MSLIGAHVSASGGVEKAASLAKKQACDVMQIFVQSPQQYKILQTTDEEAARFRASLKKNNIKEAYVHAPYLINLASSNNKIRYGSINLIRKNLERASALGCTYLMTHLGSYGIQSKQEGIAAVVKSLNKTLSGYSGACRLLLELSAGSGNIIGSRFEEIGEILSKLDRQDIGVCLDTAHIFASGYDMTTKKSIKSTFDEFNKHIGLKKLTLVHLNDSQASLGSNKDRHADIGEGQIGLENLCAFMNSPKLKSINFILETPGDPLRRKKDIQTLKKCQRQA